MMNKPKIKSTEQIYNSVFVNLNKTIYKDKDNKERAWEWASRKNNMGAVVMAMLHGDIEGNPKIVAIKQYRIPVDDYIWELPAGLIESNENIYLAATRELKEETGLEVITFYHMETPTLFNSAGLTNESCKILYGICDGEISKEFQESSEFIDIFLLSQNDIINLLNDEKEKFAAKAYLVFKYFAETAGLPI